MPDALREMLGYRMTIAEWLGTAVLLGVPYIVIGVVWTVFRADTVIHFEGLQKPVAIIGSVVFWPLLIVGRLCAL
ncbi:hypothetical protein ACQI4F_18700 [Mycolicibacterium vaccae]|uniref:hypothetical protein n=1 Tax=Mycolicibacterium vaccae TaxID=1810 RepID=UPI003CEEF71D